jgi:hypothetical protein
VLLCACIAAITGTLIILYMPLAWVLRISLAAVFIAENLREMKRLVCGAARIRHISLDAEGNIAALGPGGRVEPLTLLSGSIVLNRLAWLRLRFADGSEHGELCCGDPVADPEWQRLQLIWRYRRRPIGGHDGS